jgi:hypothetical protein
MGKKRGKKWGQSTFFCRSTVFLTSTKKSTLTPFSTETSVRPRFLVVEPRLGFLCQLDDFFPVFVQNQEGHGVVGDFPRAILPR